MNFVKRSSILFILFTLCLFSCKEKNNKTTTDVNENMGFVISGKMNQVKDSTKIYLNDSGKFIDSTYVVNGDFIFTGNVNEPKIIVLQTKDSQKNGYALIWVENQEITVETKTDNLREAIIEGGGTQKQQSVLNKKTDSINTILDQIEKKYRYVELSESTRDSVIKAQDELFDQLDEIQKSFIKTHPDSYVSAYLLNIYKTSWNKDLVSSLYNSMNESIQKSTYGKALEQFLSIPKKPNLGDQYVDFELPDTNGKPIKLSDVSGKYILVEFWASWCAPCRKENPELIKTYNSFQQKGFEVVGISLDNNKKNWIKAIEKDELPWLQISDLKAQESYPALVYSVNMIPYNFLIDQNGIIVAENLRGNQLNEKLEELFGS